jgi:hypothetical protein
MVNVILRPLRLDKDDCRFVSNGWYIDLIISRFQFWITIRKSDYWPPYYHFRYVWWKWKHRYWKLENGVMNISGTSGAAW